MTGEYNDLSPTAPVLRGDNKPFDRYWYRFFASLVAAADVPETISAGASPTSYTATRRGSVIVSGGTVSGITITRSGTTVTLGATAGAVPVAKGDVVAVTWTVAPTLTFMGD